MSSLYDKLRQIDADDALELASAALEAIGLVTGNVAAQGTAAVLQAVQGIYEAVTDAADKAISAQEAQDAMAALTQQIRDNDTAADKALDAKFDAEE